MKWSGSGSRRRSKSGRRSEGLHRERWRRPRCRKARGTELAKMSIALLRGRNTAPGQACLEPNGVASVVQSFIVHGAMSRGVGGPLDQKNRAANWNLERSCDCGLGRGGLQYVFGLDERGVVSFFQQSKDG